MLFCSSNKQNALNKQSKKNKPRKVKNGISKKDIVLNSNDLKFPMKREEGIHESQVSIKSFSNTINDEAIMKKTA